VKRHFYTEPKAPDGPKEHFLSINVFPYLKRYFTLWFMNYKNDVTLCVRLNWLGLE